MDITVQTISETPQTFQDVERQGETIDASLSVEGIKPIDERVALESLGINDDPEVMPEVDRENLAEMTTYIKAILKTKGIAETRDNFTNALNDLKFDMGLDPQAEPSVVLDRIAGVVKSWKEISFIKNPQEKRALFMKLARLPSSKEMNKVVFEEMQRAKIWQ